jgi:hypothetical protein
VSEARWDALKVDLGRPAPPYRSRYWAAEVRFGLMAEGDFDKKLLSSSGWPVTRELKANGSKFLSRRYLNISLNNPMNSDGHRFPI